VGDGLDCKLSVVDVFLLAHYFLVTASFSYSLFMQNGKGVYHPQSYIICIKRWM
jgi:hypothetical protein